jgi:hypothetical protein
MKTFNSIFGKYFGYPQCCIDAFGEAESIVFFEDRPAIVQKHAANGYVPCEKCATDYENGINMLERINNNRSCSVPFAEKHTGEEQEQINQELNMLRYAFNSL